MCLVAGWTHAIESSGGVLTLPIRVSDRVLPGRRWPGVAGRFLRLEGGCPDFLPPREVWRRDTGPLDGHDGDDTRECSARQATRKEKTTPA